MPNIRSVVKDVKKSRQNHERNEKGGQAINGPPIIADLIRQEIDERLQSFLDGVHRLLAVGPHDDYDNDTNGFPGMV